MSFGCLFLHPHLIVDHSNIAVQLGKMTKKDQLTLDPNVTLSLRIIYVLVYTWTVPMQIVKLTCGKVC